MRRRLRGGTLVNEDARGSALACRTAFTQSLVGWDACGGAMAHRAAVAQSESLDVDLLYKLISQQRSIEDFYAKSVLL